MPGRNGRQQWGSSRLSCHQHLHLPWATENVTDKLGASKCQYKDYLICFFFFFSYTTIQNRFVALIISFPSSWGWRHPSGAVSRFWEDYLSTPLTPLTIIYLRKRKNPWVEILEGGVSWEVSSSASIKPKTCHLFCQGSLALKPLQVLKQEVLLQGKVQGVRTATL